MNRKCSLPALLLLCTLAVSVTACGQRGPLYLPEPEQPAPLEEENGEKDEETSADRRTDAE